ncbi:Fork head transcription factor 1 [Tetrabaena socialis]|uniref:Fork head transcription factor 1 n=1 Tax=Tetrabaena socialis TaxID=47790 RepID=A0A2J8AEP6_9CHLO|nr:Fork head transcription factor 1 [Tetrabaena socialis]|eukprot:PNH10982.1 Fork head transcription factor 1 [Tetrabaena socialis]
MEEPGPSSSGHHDPRLQRCGFAKLQGQGIEYFVRKYEITMGRVSKNSPLDLVLGDTNTISRQHAAIRYNFDTKCFELVVLGKNGVQVDSGNGETHLYTPESPPTPLKSRDLLTMGEKRFYFLLPRTPGGQSRKRRRTDPSPAPPDAAPPPAAATGHIGGAPAPPQHPQAAPMQYQQPQQPQQQQQLHPQHYVQGLGAAVLQAPVGGLHLQQQHYASHHLHQQQHPDEDDALISASALPYDNGAAFDNGFPGF